MQKTFGRCLALFLALTLILGTMPTAFASESERISSETTVVAPPTEEATTATEPATAEESVGEEDLFTASDDIAAYASTQNSILLFDYTDNGDYTTRLNSQINISYKWNGTGSTLSCYLKNMGWHFARYNNTPYADDPLYCIEPHKSYAASTSGNSVDRDMTLDGSSSTTGGNIWYSLNANRREAIGLILLYSNQMWDHSISVSTTKKDDNPNVPLRIATQFLIFEIVTGLRDADTFQLKSSNECGTSGDIYYNAGVASVSGFAPKYNTLVSYVEAAMQIPSFTSASSSTAPTIELTGDTTSVYDSNGVLSGFSFTNGNGAKFTKSGNTLTITQTGAISENMVFKATKSIPSAENSTYSIWYMSGSKYQTTINLYNPSTGNLTAYFKLKAPSLGNLSLTKTTEDGKNLSGWKFGIYSNSACTNLVSGPHTTNSSGKISVTGLSAGTYYVKEFGHTDSSINALYTCASTNPQKVTITNGGTASVSFHNKLNTGSIAIQKQTNTGENLGGWKIGLYTDSGCTTPVSGSPFTTANDGTIGLARSDRNIPNVEDYYNSVVKYIQENIDENERLHKAKSTDNSRMILALTAIGKDVTDVDGHNLLAGLNSMDYIKKQGNNGPIWALIALDSGNYPVPEGDVTRKALIDEILSVQTSDGGWAISGDEADADMTGMALTALAPYYKKDLNVLAAVDKAIECLSQMQDADGGFSTFSGDGGKVATSESTAQVIVALTALGINPDTDSRFIKNGNSAVDALIAYFVNGGGFKHIMTGERDGMATEQAYYALTAYYRFLEEKTRLYDMTDVIDMGGDPEEIVAETTEPTVPATTEPVEANDNGSVPWAIMVLVLAAGFGGGIATVTLVLPRIKKKRS